MGQKVLAAFYLNFTATRNKYAERISNASRKQPCGPTSSQFETVFSCKELPCPATRANSWRRSHEPRPVDLRRHRTPAIAPDCLRVGALRPGDHQGRGGLRRPVPS